MNAEPDFELREAAAKAVREINRQGRPATCRQVVDALAGAEPKDAEKLDAARIGALLAAHEGLASFVGLSGETVYHDLALLSATYARILDRKASPLALMAEEIRLNARDYRRPVPVELFESPPFELTPQQIREALQDMAATTAYEDITFTTTASGAVYLFSTQGLERSYAHFLAEHAENLAMNP